MRCNARSPRTMRSRKWSAWPSNAAARGAAGAAWYAKSSSDASRTSAKRPTPSPPAGARSSSETPLKSAERRRRAMPTYPKQQTVPTAAADFVSAVLGTKVDLDGDPRKIEAALDKSFQVSVDANGKSFVTFAPQSFINVVGDGATLTGRPKSRLDRAAAIAGDIRVLIAKIPPLRADVCEDANTVKSIFLDCVDAVVNELGKAEGAIGTLLTSFSNQIAAQFEELTSRLGYDPACINDIEQELHKTDLDTANQYVRLLQAICDEANAEALGQVDASLGTQSEKIGRELMCVSEATQHLADSLEDGVIQPHCATIELPDGTATTVGSFLDALGDFAQNGSLPLISHGADGYELSLAPTLAVFADAVKCLHEHKDHDGCRQPKLFAADNVKQALYALQETVCRASTLASQIKRPKPAYSYESEPGETVVYGNPPKGMEFAIYKGSEQLESRGRQGQNAWSVPGPGKYTLHLRKAENGE